MKKYIIRITTLFVALIALSCSDDFLDLKPLDEANFGNSFQSPQDVNLAVMGVYDILQKNGYPKDMAILSELITDNGTIQPARFAVAGAHDEREAELFQLTNENSNVNSRWNNLYKGIARANLVLSQIQTIPFADENLKNQYVGEAKFLRALFYFDLVRFFGEVPISLEEITSSEQAFELGRRPVEEVYRVIVSDLTQAMEDLPDVYSSSETGRVTSFAAKALLAKVFLTQDSADAAIPLLREVTQAGYALMGRYAEVFDTDNTAESIFEIQYTDKDPNEGNPYPQFFLPRDGTSGSDVFGSGYLGGNGNGSIIPTQDLWDSYAQDDPRRTYNIAKYYSGQENDTIFRINKYRGAPTAPDNSEDNIIVLRYADVLLMLAEAINETSGGPTREAYNLVNQVRNRAGQENLSEGLGYESFKDVLLEERRLEFAFENHRWFDLIRFGKAVEVLSAKGHEIQPFHLLMPIPRNEVEINDLIDQNIGY